MRAALPIPGNTGYAAVVGDTATGADDPYLGSFQSAINAGVPFVMVALATYARIDPGHLAAFSARIMHGLLRAQTHFGGVTVSDDLGAAQAGRPDHLPEPAAATAMDQAMLGRAGADPGFRATVNAAVIRILAAKQGLSPHAVPLRG